MDDMFFSIFCKVEEQIIGKSSYVDQSNFNVSDLSLGHPV